MRTITLLLLFCALRGAAQITVTNATFPSVGDSLQYQTDPNPPALALGNIGEGDQNWDFTALQGGPTQTTQYLDAASGAGAANFPNATMRISTPVRETYLRKKPAVFENLGTSGADQLNLGLNVNIRYQPPLPERRAPMNFFDVKNFENDLTLALPIGDLADSLLGQLGGLVDSFRFRIHTKRLDVVDAWGTCHIPGGSFPVLREKRTQTTETGIDVHTFFGWVDISTFLGTVGGGGGTGGGGLLANIGKDTSVIYRFVSNDSKEEIAVLTMNNAGTEVQSVRFKHVPLVGTSAVASEPPTLLVSPNPTSGSIDLRLEHFPAADYLLKINDLCGKTLLQQNAAAANNRISLDLSSLPTGLLLLHVFDKDGRWIGSEKILKQAE